MKEIKIKNNYFFIGTVGELRQLGKERDTYEEV